MKVFTILLKWTIISLAAAGLTYYFYPNQAAFLSFYFRENLVVYSTISIVGSVAVNVFFALLMGRVKPVNASLAFLVPLSILEETSIREIALLATKLSIFYFAVSQTDVVAILVIVALLQALFFLVVHKEIDLSLNRFFLGLFWFGVVWNAGVLPAVFGHIAANVSIKILAASQQNE